MTWKHVALIAIAALMVLACGLSNSCNRDSIKDIITFASVIAGIVGGNAMQSKDNGKADVLK